MSSKNFSLVSTPFPRATPGAPPAPAAQAKPEQLFQFQVPEGYRQGRGAFGGLVMAALTRATDACEQEPERSLRSISGAIPAPVLIGEATISVTPIRIGSGVSTWEAKLIQAGEICAQATLVYGKSRPNTQNFAPAAPQFKQHWQDCEVLPMGHGIGPEFSQHFEFRSIGPLPLSSPERAYGEGWIRPRVPFLKPSAADLVGLIDAWWPAALTREATLRPMATLAFTAQLCGDIEELDEAPLYFRSRADISSAGYSVEFRELWTERGQLVMLNQQTFVVIR